MERKVITVNDFQNVARNNEYFLWHFLQKNQENSTLSIYSYFKERINDENKVKELVDLVEIPYFESYVEDSIDFLNGLGIPYEKLWSSEDPFNHITRNERFTPVIIGFNKFTNVLSTFDKCYCVKGILEIIEELNPKFLLSVDTED